MSNPRNTKKSDFTPGAKASSKRSTAVTKRTQEESQESKLITILDNFVSLNASDGETDGRAQLVSSNAGEENFLNSLSVKTQNEIGLSVEYFNDGYVYYFDLNKVKRWLELNKNQVNTNLLNNPLFHKNSYAYRGGLNSFFPTGQVNYNQSKNEQTMESRGNSFKRKLSESGSSNFPTNKAGENIGEKYHPQFHLSTDELDLLKSVEGMQKVIEDSLNEIGHSAGDSTEKLSNSKLRRV